MKIVKGQKYLCVKESNFPFTKGKTYRAIGEEGCIKNDEGYFLYETSFDGLVAIKEAKWAIKRTPENAEVVNRWANENKLESDSGNYIDNEGFIHSDDVPCKITVCYKSGYQIKDGYTEIDFETFKEITGMGEEKKQDINIPRWLNLTTAEMRHITGFPEGMSQHEEALNIVKRTKRYIIDRYKESEATQQKIFTIEDVRNGRCAIENDGTVEELNKVLKAAFPDDPVTCGGTQEKYHANPNSIGFWNVYYDTDLPTQSVKLFLSQIERGKDQLTEEWQPKWGEEVEGRFSNGSAWIPCKYCCQSTVNEFGFICEFGDGALSRAIAIRKPLQIHTFTTEQAKKELANLHNLNVNQIKITE